MKNMFLIIICISLSFSSLAQDIPKKAKSIVISVAETDQEKVYKLLASHLVENGYTIQTADKDLGIINTELRKFGKYAWEVRISASILGNKIKFTGKQFLPDYDKSEQSIQYIGVKGAMYKASFDEVNRVATSFPNTGIEYSFQ